AHLTFDDIRVDEIHDTCEAAGKAAWEFVSQDDPPGWMLCSWTQRYGGENEDDWEAAMIQGFTAEVSEKGFYKLVNGASMYGENYCQITRVEVASKGQASAT
ncbi:MAG: hypothetical protein SGILL_010098, partial [Bacillariaceae sp.]